MKRLSVMAVIKLILVALTVLMIVIFLVLTGNMKREQEKKAQQLQTEIENVVVLCKSFDQRVSIDENLKGYTDIYAENISKEESIVRRAYFAKIMVTYTMNRVNMNNPKMLMELAQETGEPFEVNTGQFHAFSQYSEELNAASQNLTLAYNDYIISVENTTE